MPPPPQMTVLTLPIVEKTVRNMLTCLANENPEDVKIDTGIRPMQGLGVGQLSRIERRQQPLSPSDGADFRHRCFLQAPYTNLKPVQQKLETKHRPAFPFI